MATPKQGREEGVQEGRKQPLGEGWPHFPRGPRGLDAAPRPVRSPHRRLWRSVHGGRAGVPDSRAAGAVGEAASQQTKKTKRLTPRTVTLAVRHDDDLGALLRNVTLSRGGVMPSLNRALAKKQKSPKQARGTPSA
ncbi:putative C terminus of histone H2A [Trypanosoma vivax]|nr:putative C terminus of histone H2A [Trypanosoma vivax]